MDEYIVNLTVRVRVTAENFNKAGEIAIEKIENCQDIKSSIINMFVVTDK